MKDDANRSNISEKDSDSDSDDDDPSLLEDYTKAQTEKNVRLTGKERRQLRKQFREDKLQRQIYEHIIKEENKFQTLLKETGKLPYPCECGSLCDYRPIIKQLLNAFNRLYDAYENLFVDYHILFVSDRIIPENKQRKLKFSKDIKKLAESNDANTNNIFGALLSRFRSRGDFQQCNDNYKSVINKEDYDYHRELYEQSFDLKFEELVDQEDDATRNYTKNLAKLQVIHNSRPYISRFFEWICSHITGRKECFCFHCSDRDNLDIYHLAIATLYKEYRDMYLDFLGLYYREEVSERYDRYISVVTTSKYQEARTCSELIFKKALANLVIK